MCFIELTAVVQSSDAQKINIHLHVLFTQLIILVKLNFYKTNLK